MVTLVQKFQKLQEGRGKDYLLVILFFLISLAGVIYHELSLDEARPWIIVSETPATSLISETRCEMHCLPWFYFLKLLSGVFSSPITLQIFGILMGTGAFALLIFFSPFGILEKSLFLLNYYLLYEFNIISRPYILMTLGLFLICAAFPSRSEKPLRFLVSILFLAHTTYFGIFLSFPFVALFLFELLAKKMKPSKNTLISIFTILAFYLGSVVWYAIPLSASAGCVDLEMQNIPLTFTHLKESIWDLTRAFFIIGNGTWNEHVFDNDPQSRNLLSIFWIAFVALTGFSLRKNPRGAFLFLSSVFLLFCYRFTKTVYYGSFFRHLGALAVMYISCMWVAWNGQVPGRLGRYLFIVFLLFGTYSGVRLYSEDIARPFSNGGAVADFISTPELVSKTIVPDSVLFTSPYLIFSQRKYVDYIREPDEGARYYPLSETVKPVYVEAAHIRGRHIVPRVREEVFRKAIDEHRMEHPLVIINYPLAPGKSENMKLRLLKSFNGAINPNEDFSVYTAE